MCTTAPARVARGGYQRDADVETLIVSSFLQEEGELKREARGRHYQTVPAWNIAYSVRGSVGS